MRGLQYTKIAMGRIRSPAHLALSREVATKSLVLLANRNRTLPLRRRQKIAVVGPFADCQACYFGKYSPHLDVNRTTTVAEGLKAAGHVVTAASGCSEKGNAAAAAATARRRQQQGCGCVSCPCPSGGGPEPYMCAGYNATAVTEAVSGADVVVLAVGLGANVESEGRDRQKLGLGNSNPRRLGPSWPWLTVHIFCMYYGRAARHAERAGGRRDRGGGGPTGRRAGLRGRAGRSGSLRRRRRGRRLPVPGRGHGGRRRGRPDRRGAGPPQHGLYSNKMALITSDCGKMRYLSIEWP